MSYYHNVVLLGVRNAARSETPKPARKEQKNVRRKENFIHRPLQELFRSVAREVDPRFRSRDEGPHLRGQGGVLRRLQRKRHADPRSGASQVEIGVFWISDLKKSWTTYRVGTLIEDRVPAGFLLSVNPGFRSNLYKLCIQFIIYNYVAQCPQCCIIKLKGGRHSSRPAAEAALAGVRPMYGALTRPSFLSSEKERQGTTTTTEEREMEHSEITKLIAVICSGLFDAGPADIHPASSIYLVLDMDMAKFETVKHFLEKLGFARFTSETVRLTPKGMELGKNCSEVLAFSEKA